MLRPGVMLHVYGFAGAPSREALSSLEPAAGALEDGDFTYLVFERAMATELSAAGLSPSYEASLLYEDWLDADLREPLEEAGLIIVPPWCEGTLQGGAILSIEPSLVFGTGGHATTRRCLHLIERLLRDDARGTTRVLDLGCGTGVLSLAALKLGAAQAIGCDICALAVEVAQKNARSNGLQTRAVYHHSPAAAIVDEAELVLANLPPAALGELLGHPALTRSRWIIASGLLAPDLVRLRRALPEGATIVEEHVDGFWHTALIESARTTATT